MIAILLAHSYVRGDTVPAQALSQMNIRMNKQLKDAGDKILAESGRTPTQIVRSLWEKISRGSADLQQVEEMLGNAGLEVPTHNTTTQKVEAMQRGRALFAEGLSNWGIHAGADVSRDDKSDTDLYIDALVDRMREKDLW